MDDKKYESLREYAWSYFSIHANQRMTTFNFYLVTIGLLSGGIFAVANSDNKTLMIPAGILISIFSILFYLLDRRNVVLVRNGENAIKVLDQIALPSTDTSINPVLRIFENDDAENRKRGLHISYSNFITAVCFIFVVFGIFVAIYPRQTSKDKIDNISLTGSVVVQCKMDTTKTRMILDCRATSKKNKDSIQDTKINMNKIGITKEVSDSIDNH